VKADTSLYRLMYAQIRYYYKIPNPEELDDDYVVMLYQDLVYLREKEAKEKPTIIKL
jgi:hypothetical protein